MIFAKPGESQQQFGGECPSGWVEMSGSRPGGAGWVASETGDWVQPIPTKNELLNDALKRYNADIELFSKQMSGAALADGPSEEAKRAKIRAAYELRKAEYNNEIAQIKAS